MTRTPLLAVLCAASGCSLGGSDPLCAACTERCAPDVLCVSGACVASDAPLPRDATLACDGEGGAMGVCRFVVRERIAWTPSSAVDVLFVVDDSISMAAEQSRVALSFQSLLAAVSAHPVDYRIGVTTTDVESCDSYQQCLCVAPALSRHGGHLGSAPGAPRVLAPPLDAPRLPTDPPLPEDAPRTESELLGWFSANVRVGTDGCMREQGLEAARLALGVESEPGGANDGFRRPHAALAVIFVSDEDDCSHPEGALAGAPTDACGSRAGALTPALEYAAFLRSLAADPRRVLLAAIVGGVAARDDASRLVAADCRTDARTGSALPRGGGAGGACDPEGGACAGHRYVEVLACFRGDAASADGACTSERGGAAVFESICRDGYTQAMTAVGRFAADQTRGVCLAQAPHCEHEGCRGEIRVWLDGAPVDACCEDGGCAQCFSYLPPDQAGCPRIVFDAASRPAAVAQVEVEYAVDPRGVCRPAR